MKSTAFILTLILALSCLPACAESTLDAAFESGSVTLVETKTAGFDLAACEIVIPDNYWEYNEIEKPSEDDLPGMIMEALADAAVISVSPTGGSALLCLNNRELFALNGGSIALLCPSETRGTADEYGNMRKSFKTLRSQISEEGVVWSPDGRYALIPNASNYITFGRLTIDPMIIDTMTGEVFLTAAYGNNILPKNDNEIDGTLTTACFSRDGRYLYYTFRGTIGQYRFSLLRCELAAGKTELLYNGEDLIYYPRLSELRDGSFFILCDVNNNHGKMGVARLAGSGLPFSLTGGSWGISVASFDLPAEQWYVRLMDYSPESGWAVCIGGLPNSLDYALQRFRPDEGCAGMNQRWMLRADTLAFIPVEGDTQNVLSQMFTDGSLRPDADYLALMASQLSPDGQYALVQYRKVTGDGSFSFPLLLVRLEDMKAVPVTGIPEDALSPYHTALTRKYAPGMEWNCDQLVLLADNSIRTYRFDVGN